MAKSGKKRRVVKNAMLSRFSTVTTACQRRLSRLLLAAALCTKLAPIMEHPIAMAIDTEEMRANLGYNCELERKALFDFVAFGEQCLVTLRREDAAMQNEEYNTLWRNRLHTLAEEAEKIGAGALHEILARAELQFHADPAVKNHLLDLISREFSKAQLFIRTVVGE